MRQEQNGGTFFNKKWHHLYMSDMNMVCCCARFLLIMRWWFRLDDWNDNKMSKPEFVIECIYLGSFTWGVEDRVVKYFGMWRWQWPCFCDLSKCLLAPHKVLSNSSTCAKGRPAHTFFMTQCDLFTQHAKQWLSQHLKYSAFPRKKQAINALKMIWWGDWHNTGAL